MSDSFPVATGLRQSRLRIALKIVLKYLLSPIGMVLRPTPGLRVLFYHRVNTHRFEALGLVSREVTVPKDAFKAQMAYLAEHGFRTLTLAQAEAMLAGEVPFDPKAVLITFDDGYRDNLDVAAPILAKHGFRATVFPVLNLIGKDNRPWPMSDPEPLGQFMDDKDLRAWLAEGHDMGSHTLTHPILTHVDDETLVAELEQSRIGFESRFDRPCTAVAYPRGDVDARVVRAARQAGYRCGLTITSGSNPVGTDPFLVKRTEVSASDTNFIFRLKMNGTYDWLGVRDSKVYRKIMRMFHRLSQIIALAPKGQTS